MRAPESGAFWKNWDATLIAKRPEIPFQDQSIRHQDVRNQPRLCIHVTRDFRAELPESVLILPDEVPAHPYAIAMEWAMLPRKAEVSISRGKNRRNEFR
jgi:hypothetical protein